MDETKKKKDQKGVGRGTPGDGWLWSALLFALLACEAFIYVAYGMLFTYSPSLSLIYSIVLVLQNESYILSLHLCGAIVFLLLIMKALTRLASAGCALLVFVAGVGIFFISLFFSLFNPITGATPLQTLTHENHLYRLLYVKMDNGSDRTEAYVVVQCDSVGLACRYYAAPIVDDSWTDWDVRRKYAAYGLEGRLFVDDTDQKLYLRANEDVYPMADLCGMFIGPRSGVRYAEEMRRVCNP